MTEPQLSSTFSHTLLEKIHKMDFLGLKEKEKKIHKGHQKSIRVAQLVNILKNLLWCRFLVLLLFSKGQQGVYINSEYILKQGTIFILETGAQVKEKGRGKGRSKGREDLTHHFRYSHSGSLFWVIANALGTQKQKFLFLLCSHFLFLLLWGKKLVFCSVLLSPFFCYEE